MKMEIDWSKFEDGDEYTCYCRCGNIYRSYAKYVSELGLYTKDQCPECKGHRNISRIVSDTATYTLERRS